MFNYYYFYYFQLSFTTTNPVVNCLKFEDCLRFLQAKKSMPTCGLSSQDMAGTRCNIDITAPACMITASPCVTLILRVIVPVEARLSTSEPLSVFRLSKPDRVLLNEV